jgi:hypothetical protein
MANIYWSDDERLDVYTMLVSMLVREKTELIESTRPGLRYSQNRAFCDVLRRACLQLLSPKQCLGVGLCGLISKDRIRDKLSNYEMLIVADVYDKVSSLIYAGALSASNANLIHKIRAIVIEEMQKAGMLKHLLAYAKQPEEQVAKIPATIARPEVVLFGVSYATLSKMKNIFDIFEAIAIPMCNRLATDRQTILNYIKSNPIKKGVFVVIELGIPTSTVINQYCKDLRIEIGKICQNAIVNVMVVDSKNHVAVHDELDKFVRRLGYTGL